MPAEAGAHAAALAELRAQFGADQVLSGPAAAPYDRDWRVQFPGAALAVLRPRAVAELQAMVRACAARALPLVPQGGATGLVGGSTAAAGELLLSLTRLDRLRSLRPADMIDLPTAALACALRSRLDNRPG